MADDGRREDEDERNPGLQHQMFVIMEDLLDKLKLLDYEEQVLVKHNMKPLSRYSKTKESCKKGLIGANWFVRRHGLSDVKYTVLLCIYILTQKL